MNQKQLTILIVVGVLAGALGLYFIKRDKAGWQSTNQAVGQKLLADFPLNDVTHIHVKTADAELNLAKGGEVWTVREREDFPANFADISDLLRKVWELKVVQSEKVGASQLPRLELVEPGKGDKSGTLVEFKNSSGKVLGSLLLGKKHLKKAETPSPFGDEGWPDGRYVLVPGANQNVALINDPLANVEPKPEQWLSRDFFRVEKIQSVSVTYPEATNSWKLSRDAETGTLALAEVKDSENFDASKAPSVANTLSSASFTDVVLSTAKPEDTGLDKPIVAELHTFEGFRYTVKIGKADAQDNYHITFDVAADLSTERKPVADEKSEDKEKLDQEFQATQTKLKEKLAKEKALAGRTYLVSKWSIDPILKTRAELMVSDKPEAAPAAPSGIQGLPPGFTLPEGILPQ